MGLKTPVINGARQELPCMESPEVNGARQDVAAVEKFVSGAWQEIWTNAKYFMRDGVFVNGGAYSEAVGFNNAPTVSNGYYTITNNSGDSSQLILKFPADSKLVGKTLYVIVGDAPYLLSLGYNSSGHMWLDYAGGSTYTCALPSNSDPYYYLNFRVQNPGDKLSIKDIYVK